VVPHAFTSRWTAITVAALKKHKNVADFDILMVDCSPGHPSIRTITETSLGEGVKVIDPPAPNIAGHQVALDQAIDLVETPWYVAFETDVRVLRDGWLDWLLSFVKDDYVAMVGWNWASDADDSRHYISPAGALYRTSVLKLLKEECLRNKDMACCYGLDMSKRIDFLKDFPHTAGKLIKMGLWGPFLESRGFGNVYPFPRDYWVSEPGNWIYNRIKMQWEVIHVPGEMVVNEDNIPGLPHKYAYIGPSEAEAYYKHYWAGSVSHNFDKHKIGEWDAIKLPWWLTREHTMWEETVPKDVQEYCINNGLVRAYGEELEYALSRVVRP
jgi:hypothetical protein